jgi:hypothetical protein
MCASEIEGRDDSSVVRVCSRRSPKEKLVSTSSRRTGWSVAALFATVLAILLVRRPTPAPSGDLAPHSPDATLRAVEAARPAEPRAATVAVEAPPPAAAPGDDRWPELRRLLVAAIAAKDRAAADRLISEIAAFARDGERVAFFRGLVEGADEPVLEVRHALCVSVVRSGVDWGAAWARDRFRDGTLASHARLAALVASLEAASSRTYAHTLFDVSIRRPFEPLDVRDLRDAVAGGPDARFENASDRAQFARALAPLVAFALEDDPAAADSWADLLLGDPRLAQAEAPELLAAFRDSPMRAALRERFAGSPKAGMRLHAWIDLVRDEEVPANREAFERLRREDSSGVVRNMAFARLTSAGLVSNEDLLAALQEPHDDGERYTAAWGLLRQGGETESETLDWLLGGSADPQAIRESLKIYREELRRAPPWDAAKALDLLQSTNEPYLFGDLCQAAALGSVDGLDRALREIAADPARSEQIREIAEATLASLSEAGESRR